MIDRSVRRLSLSRRTVLALSRRTVLAATAGFAGTAAMAGRGALAQQSARLPTPTSVVTTPPRDWTPGHPSIYPDPDVIVVDPSFNQVRRAIAGIQRVWTGALWAEGPA